MLALSCHLCNILPGDRALIYLELVGTFFFQPVINVLRIAPSCYPEHSRAAHESATRPSPRTMDGPRAVQSTPVAGSREAYATSIQAYFDANTCDLMRLGHTCLRMRPSRLAHPAQ
jgi:hypothetical protein